MKPVWRIDKDWSVWIPRIEEKWQRRVVRSVQHRSVIARQQNKSLDGWWREIRVFSRNAVMDRRIFETEKPFKYSNIISFLFQFIFLNQWSFWASLSSSNFRNTDVSNMQSQLVLASFFAKERLCKLSVDSLCLSIFRSDMGCSNLD